MPPSWHAHPLLAILLAADDDEDYSDEQGVTPRAGSGDAGKAGGQGGSRKGQARPRSNINFDALVDPNLPPEEARRMRRWVLGGVVSWVGIWWLRDAGLVAS